MSTLFAVNNEYLSYTTSSSGSSSEHYKLQNKSWKAKAHRLEPVTLKYNTSLYLLSSPDISEFENRVEEIRESLLEKLSVLSKEDLKILNLVVDKFDLLRLLAIIRLLGPLLENESYTQDAIYVIRKLLKHPEPEVRYAVLEAIGFALGEVPIADKILAEAKDLLKNEESTFVQEYLESL